MNRITIVLTFLLFVLTSCNDETIGISDSFVVGQHYKGGSSMGPVSILIPEENCLSSSNHSISVPVGEATLKIANCWGVSPGGTYYSSKIIVATSISDLGSIDGTAQSYVYGTEIPFDSEFAGRSIGFNSLGDYLTLRVDSDHGEFVGWIEFERESSNLLITDFSFARL